MAETEQARNILKPHSYDGIQEYDNNLPNWWVWLFILTHVWAVFYIGYYHFGPGEVGVEAWATEREAVLEARAASSVGPYPEEILRGFLSSNERLSDGEALFNGPGGACYTCHQSSLLGQAGPNLRDDYWKHGNQMQQIVATITHGYPDAGMPANALRLNRDQIANLAAYVVHQNRSRKVSGEGLAPIEGEVLAPIDY